jgi:biotin operon repressor
MIAHGPDNPSLFQRSVTYGNVTRPTFGVASIRLSWTMDPNLPDDAFRLLVLLHDDTLPEVTSDDDLGLLLGCSSGEIRRRYRALEAAGYLVQNSDGTWCRS